MEIKINPNSIARQNTEIVPHMFKYSNSFYSIFQSHFHQLTFKKISEMTVMLKDIIVTMWKVRDENY